jgi:hydrogenase expression/formation protein HypC
MCIAAPVVVMDIGDGPMPMGHVLSEGEPHPCCFAYVPEAQVGDYVLVQNGFAMQLLDEESVALSQAAFEELAAMPSAIQSP